MEYLIFGIPVLMALASWWAWATLLSRPRRWRDLPVLVVPAVYGFGLWVGGFQVYPSAEWLFGLGLISGPVFAGLLLALSVRRFMRLGRRERLAVAGSALVSLGVLLTMLVLFWSAGRSEARGVHAILGSSYAGALLLSVALTWLGTGRQRQRSIGRAPAVTVGIVSAAMAATFFYPVEFINSCYVETVFRYSLC